MPFSHQSDKGTSSAAQMCSHYLWFASWGILEDFCPKEGENQQHHGVPPMCSKNTGRESHYEFMGM